MIGDSEYESKLFDGGKQVFVMKRLLPAFGALAGVASALRTEDGERPGFEQIAQALQPVTVALAKLDDDDVDYVLNACLEVTKRRVRVGAGWMPVMSNGAFPDEADKTFAARLQIAWHVISENFADMFASFGVDLPALKPGA